MPPDVGSTVLNRYRFNSVLRSPRAVAMKCDSTPVSSCRMVPSGSRNPCTIPEIVCIAGAQ
jgi:hypothetical protein